jgi:phosphoribosylaminoimidazolecarboxamide formyltransferase/IMP cyclohydrolase
MLRSASKNFQDVAVIVDPSDYKKIIREMKKLKGGISYKTRLGLAKKVFKRTSQYDKAIAAYLAKVAKEQL